MRLTQLQRIVLPGLLMLLSSCSQVPDAATPDASATSPTTASSVSEDGAAILVIGDISDEPAKKIGEYQPMADYLASQLQDVGFESAEVRVAPDMETMAQWLASGEVDLYFDSPFPALIVSEKSGAEPMLRRWKDGVSEYNSVIFTRADSNIDSLDDLQGQLIAFEEAFSTSGYMLPLAYLVEAGFTVTEKASPSVDVADGEIGFVFTGNEQNTIQWALNGRTAAAAVSAPDYEDIPAEIRDQLVVLAETEALPRNLTLASATLSPEQQSAIKTVLLEMDSAESGQAVLELFQETAKFDEFPGGQASALARMQTLYELTQ